MTGTTKPKRAVIAGASLAGARAAHSLRNAGFDGTITMIGQEPYLPYDRPPLSKEFLTGDAPVDTLRLDADGAYDDIGVEVRTSTQAVALDLQRRIVTVREAHSGGRDSGGDGGPCARGNAGAAEGDDELPFDALIIATGASARMLPGAEGLDGVCTLRTADDAAAIRDRLRRGARVAVVGAGFIGSEVAASAKARGCEVTVIEAAPAPLMRGLGARIGTAVGALHARNGVSLRLGVGVDAVLGSGRVEAVALSDGSLVEADLVVVGIGVVPNTGWLEGSGLRIDDGVVCDATLCCGPPGVYAVGDVARAPNRWLGPEPVRIEHWTSAVEHGMAVGAAVVDPQAAAPHGSVPFVWSDQYDARIQIAGMPSGDDSTDVLVGDLDETSFLVGYRRGDRLAAVMARNAIRPFVRFRRLLTGHPSWSEGLELAADLRQQAQ